MINRGADGASTRDRAPPGAARPGSLPSCPRRMTARQPSGSGSARSSPAGCRWPTGSGRSWRCCCTQGEAAVARPDPPPGRGRSSGPVATPGRPLKAGSPQLPPQGPAAAMVARVIALSDERDTWLRLALAWARSAYRSGYRRGHDTGLPDRYELAVLQWKITAAGMTHLGPGRPFAELDRRRVPAGWPAFVGSSPGPARQRRGSGRRDRPGQPGRVRGAGGS